MSEIELSDWIECPACGNHKARAEMYPDCVMVSCPDCGTEHREDNPSEPTSI